jgi:hypothetical protein
VYVPCLPVKMVFRRVQRDGRWRRRHCATAARCDDCGDDRTHECLSLGWPHGHYIDRQPIDQFFGRMNDRALFRLKVLFEFGQLLCLGRVQSFDCLLKFQLIFMIDDRMTPISFSDQIFLLMLSGCQDFADSSLHLQKRHFQDEWLIDHAYLLIDVGSMRARILLDLRVRPVQLCK